MKLPEALAAHPQHSRGRLHPEPQSGPRGPRDIFQRDRDRIIHSVAFRRLRHKTQVFIAPDGDHFRVRLTHSLEVAQIGRTIARALGLNEDLTEALCLSHDLGHPPFGHAGEDALEAALADAGGFDHNAHTIRIVTRLETPYPDFDGLNLSWEALEAQVAAIADDIAYDNHDIDDGLRAGLLHIDDLLAMPLPRRLWDEAGVRHPGISTEKRQRALVRDMIGAMVGDVLAETARRVREARIATIDDVRHAGGPLAGFSEAMAGEERVLKRFLYDRLYGLPELQPVRIEAERVVADLASAYRADPSLLPEAWPHPADAIGELRTIGDFIAGMTDRFAIARHEQLVGPVHLPSDRF
jgi:dGTPase